MMVFDGIWHDGSGARPKAGEPKVVREALLMGEGRLLRLPLYVPDCTRLDRQANPVLLFRSIYNCLPIHLFTLSTPSAYTMLI